MISLCDYLANIVKEYNCPNLDDRKVLCDVTAIAALTDIDCLNVNIVPSMNVTLDGCYSEELSNKILYVNKIKVETLYSRFFEVLSSGKFLK